MFHIKLIILFVISTKQIVICEEPQCSKFHYEAQMLDKMIRTEIKVETMEKEILKTNQLVLEALQVLKREKEDFNKDYTDLKKTILDDVKVMSADAKVMRDTLRTPTVVFKARGPADVSLETGQKLIFSTRMLNEGGAYDNVTGIFTAPVAGTYLFTIQLCIIYEKNFYYGIVYDDIVFTSGRFYNNVGISYSADAILVLKSGQRVWVKCLHGQSGDVLYEYSSSTNNCWNTFSGVLIHK